ncbi:MAG: hypothetical protein PWP48_217 [Clostridiales bacterium]|jgi:hypothetical protein|nr:hypothetical protein [Clostridiales bacterium]MDK2990984.1 hypothetical protein [Clostridiales bacterium]
MKPAFGIIFLQVHLALHAARYARALSRNCPIVFIYGGNDMGIYATLNRYLSESGQEIIHLSFSEIEKLLGRPLPQSAYIYDAWWANGGHSQASAWLDAGYKVSSVDIFGRTVTFIKSGAALPKKAPVQNSKKSANVHPSPYVIPGNKKMEVCGYTFVYIQDLIPDCDASRNVIKYCPQSYYDNKRRLPLSYHGGGAFCHFSIKAGDWPGVYLWVVDERIIYIGETARLGQRFNMGYGNISPRNCYAGGQSTNCKMNKVVLDYYERGKTISLYFYQTVEHKRIELELLKQIHPPYNARDN